MALADFSDSVFIAAVELALPQAQSVDILDKVDSTTIATEASNSYTVVRYQVLVNAVTGTATSATLMSYAQDGSLVAALLEAETFTSAAAFVSAANTTDVPPTTVGLASTADSVQSIYAGVTIVQLLPPTTEEPARGYSKLDGLRYRVYETTLPFDDVRDKSRRKARRAGLG